MRLTLRLAMLLGVGLLPVLAARARAADAGQAATPGAQAQNATVMPAPVPQAYESGSSGVSEYFANWFARVEQAQASQPHWMTPLVTVTPRLEQEFRYDQYWQHRGDGGNITTFDSGKGLEFIPTLTNEVLINLPPYIQRKTSKPAEGWGDWPFLTVKQRLFSANEENGNYIVSAFLGFQAPTGSSALTNDAWIITPTIAAGKGWGDFDIQSTLGVSIPTGHESTIGTALLWNTAFQYHFARIFWPEFEVNLTHWFDGERGGKTQIFLTPGIIFGRFPLFGSRARLIAGVGYQFAVTPKLQLEPALTPVYNHAWIVSTRLAF